MTDATAAARLELESFVVNGLTGLAVVVVPPGEQEKHARELAAGPGREVRTLESLGGSGAS